MLNEDLHVKTNAALTDLYSSLEKIFGMEVSKDVIKDHMEDIEKMANGDIDAL